jgi:dihydroneopterin aldolase
VRSVRDEMEEVPSYTELIDAVTAIAADGHINLVETFAERIAERCLADRSVSEVTVRIEKPDVLLACRAVGVAITRRRG